MFGSNRRSTEATERLAASLREIGGLLRAHLELSQRGESLSDRVDALELSRAAMEAELDAEMMKAQAIYKNVRNSEERIRHQKKNDEKDLDPFPPDSEALIVSVPPRHAEGGEEDGLLQLPLALALNDKTHAMRMKYL